ALVAQVLAPPADAVHLLRQVDELEVGRECANEIARGARRQRAEQRLQLLVGLRMTFAARDRGPPRRFDEIEQRLARLLANELADELAQAMDIRPERLIL